MKYRILIDSNIECVIPQIKCFLFWRDIPFVDECNDTKKAHDLIKELDSDANITMFIQ